MAGQKKTKTWRNWKGLVYLLYLSIFTIILAQEKTFSAPRTFLGTATIERNLLISFLGFGLSSGLLGCFQMKFFLLLGQWDIKNLALSRIFVNSLYVIQKRTLSSFLLWKKKLSRVQELTPFPKFSNTLNDFRLKFWWLFWSDYF